jgi:hypothetical protein
VILISPKVERFVATEQRVEAARAALAWTLPHARSVPAPHYLVEGALELDRLEMLTGTLFVTGDLSVGVLDVQRCGRQLANIVVAGTCTLGSGYLDGFLVVRGALGGGTFVVDAAWDGGVFVGGDVALDTLVIHNTGVEVEGKRRVTKLADLERARAARKAVPGLFGADGEADVRGYFLGLSKAKPTPKSKSKSKSKSRSKSKR